jgi:phosphate transport system regulatory protein PhoU
MDTPHAHTATGHDAEHRQLVEQIVTMGQAAVTRLEQSLEAVERRDAEAARRIAAGDAEIDAAELRISQEVMRLALRGPMARDLREVLVALRIPADIERIGDYAANIARRSLVLDAMPALPHLAGLRALGMLAAGQVRQALRAYHEGDGDLALQVRGQDAGLDRQYTALFRELLTCMMEDPRNITPCTHLLFMARSLERIGDHATNIAENVWFLLHGDAPPEPREKRDGTSTLAP